MKYSEVTTDFQRRVIMCPKVRNEIALAITMTMCFLILPSQAQDAMWPVPAKATHAIAGANYTMDTFDRIFKPMHLVTVYGGTRGESGTYFGKVNVASRFQLTGGQVEAEAYPILSTRSYGYLNYAFAVSPLFPRHRLGMEYFQALPLATEGSIGFRLYAYSDRRTITLATGSLALYSGNFWFSVRPYLTVNAKKTATSFTASGRYYFGDTEEFVALRCGAGFTPDERAIQSNTGLPGTAIFYLQSQTAGAAIQVVIARRVLFIGQVDLTRQELSFLPGSFVLDATVQTGIRLLL